VRVVQLLEGFNDGVLLLEFLQEHVLLTETYMTSNSELRVSIGQIIVQGRQRTWTAVSAYVVRRYRDLGALYTR
jgi:hypothetical protein